LGDRGGQGRLPVVDVPDRPDVQVRLFSNEFFFCHPISSSSLFPGGLRGVSYHAPRIRSSIVSVTCAGTGAYRANCIVYVARPWVIERTSVESPNIADSGTSAGIA